MKQGLISQRWEITYDPSIIWSFAFHFYDSNYTDQNSIIIRIQSELSLSQIQINQSNAYNKTLTFSVLSFVSRTIVLPNTKTTILDYPDGTDSMKYRKIFQIFPPPYTQRMQPRFICLYRGENYQKASS